jgi:oligosaccharyltransferase complex subunit beta
MNRVLVLLLAVASVCLAAKLLDESSPVGTKVLVLLDNLGQRYTHSKYFRALEDKGYLLTFSKADDPDLAIAKYGEYQYDNLILFAPKTQEFGGKVEAQTILDFIDDGHNVIVAADPEVSELVRDVASGCGVDFSDENSFVIDHFNFDASDDGKHTLLVANAATDAAKVIAGSVSPLVFRGIGHTLEEDSELLFPLVQAADTAYSANPDAALTEYPHSTGKTTTLVSAMQARNNARVVFVGSVEFFSDKFFSADVQKSGAKAQKAGNQEFAVEVTRWAFKEKGVLRSQNPRHHPAGQSQPQETYRIKDNMAFEIDIFEWKDGKWQAFQANDVQLEFVRLDPHIRTALKHNKQGHFTTEFQIPDVYGVFTFKVHHKRLGLTNLEAITRVPVRPYRHNEYERFIESAFPYYAGAFSMMGGLLLFSVLFLYSKY